ncbi:squalene epoxidase-domain-containing protein [Flagelloscypha sp. PMI_526]|nr:squalene epoxidase-domain-containing protein [Flagelloscypha sp. PMI_526]
MASPSYDILIIGAGVAGSTIAHALSKLPGKPRIALLERSLATPDRIVGELLQPTGVQSLHKLSLDWTLQDIHAAKVFGYYVWDGTRQTGVHIPYPTPHEGRSFHHGSFINQLREAARLSDNVELIEATVSELVYEQGRVVGAQAKVGSQKTVVTYLAPLTIVADGCFSIFRSKLLPSTTTTKSHFVGTVLKNAVLPMKSHGTVGLVPNGNGPVLLYQIRDPGDDLEETHTRLLVDVKAPLPRDLKSHFAKNIAPYLPESVQQPILEAIESSDPECRLRTMPNSFLPPTPQSTIVPPGVFLLGDAYNMRHPLTGGGMSVALNDVVILRDLFQKHSDVPNVWADTSALDEILKEWYWQRKPLGSTINILSVALYDLFGADDRNLAILRNGCFKYFEMGGECVDGPVSLLSGIKPSPTLLFLHFFAVAFYSLIVLFTRSNPASLYGSTSTKDRRAYIWEWPALFIRSIIVFLTAVQVFGPLLWTEVRWWAPSRIQPPVATSTTRGPLKHDQLYSQGIGMRFMALIACFASVFVYYLVVPSAVVPAAVANPQLAQDITMNIKGGASLGIFQEVVDAVKNNVGDGLGSIWGTFSDW